MWRALTLLISLAAIPASAEKPQSPASLKDTVILAGSNSANDALSISVQPGAHDVDLYLQVNQDIGKRMEGKLAVTNLLAQTQPEDVAAASIHMGGAGSTRSHYSFAKTLVLTCINQSNVS